MNNTEQIIYLLSIACAAVVLVIYRPLDEFKLWIHRGNTKLTDLIYEVLTCAKCAGLILGVILTKDILTACLISIGAELIYRQISTIKLK